MKPEGNSARAGTMTAAPAPRRAREGEAPRQKAGGQAPPHPRALRPEPQRRSGLREPAVREGPGRSRRLVLAGRHVPVEPRRRPLDWIGASVATRRDPAQRRALTHPSLALLDALGRSPTLRGGPPLNPEARRGLSSRGSRQRAREGQRIGGDSHLLGLEGSSAPSARVQGAVRVAGSRRKNLACGGRPTFRGR
jgi:hypothetical protein